MSDELKNDALIRALGGGEGMGDVQVIKVVARHGFDQCFSNDGKEYWILFAVGRVDMTVNGTPYDITGPYVGFVPAGAEIRIQAKESDIAYFEVRSWRNRLIQDLITCH